MADVSGGRLSKWLLLEGDRLAVAGAIAAGVAGFVYALALLDVVTLGPGSNVRTVLSSGLTSGLLTLVTIALSINQLLLSRLFGPPEEFADRLAGTEAFRDRVSRAADTALYENEPKDFLRRIVEAIQRRAAALDDELPADAPAELRNYPGELSSYARDVAETIGDDGGQDTMDVLTALLGPAYARALTTIPRLQDEYDDALPEPAAVELAALLELVKSLAVFRQFLKTLAIQQDLARLSRLVAYTGVAGLAATVALSLAYTSGSGAVLSAGVLRPAVSLGLGVAVLPLALFVSYVLRVATISMYTVSAGSFIPPEERFQG